MSKKKATINRIHAHLCKSADLENSRKNWCMKNLGKILDDMSAEDLIQLESDGAYKVKLKPCQVQILVKALTLNHWARLLVVWYLIQRL